MSPAGYALGSIDIVVLVTLLLGGMRTLIGPVLGGILFTLIDELVRPLGRLNVMVYGVLIVVLVITFRHGVVAMLSKRLKIRLP